LPGALREASLAVKSEVEQIPPRVGAPEER
jgi:hypothetical protein